MPSYRNQERPSTPAVEIIAGPDPQDQADPILALKSARQSAASAPPYRRPGIILAVVLSCAILLFSAYAFFWGADFMRTARPGDMVAAPTMLLLPVERNPNSPVSLASSVDQTLGDALHRSWVVRTLFSDGTEATGQAANPQKDDHDYRLQSVLAGPEGEDLYLTLWDNRTNSRLWTGNVGLSGQEDNIGTALQIPLANLIGSFGAIATHQRRQYGDDLSPGYPCLLKNAELRIHPGKDNLEAARKCVNQMLAADPDSADALAAAVFVNYGLSAADPKHSKKWRDIALQQAKQAVLLDPYSANAQMAAASAAFRSEEHTSELPSLMRNSYAVFCLKKKKIPNNYLTKKLNNNKQISEPFRQNPYIDITYKNLIYIISIQTTTHPNSYYHNIAKITSNINDTNPLYYNNSDHKQ